MNTPTDLLSTLISIPSVTNDGPACKDAVDMVVRLLTPTYDVQHFETHATRSALFFSKKYSYTTRFSVILNAHLDVVPGSSSQFTPAVKSGRLYGRGAQDMKSGASVMIQVFQKLAEGLTYPIALQIATDEETGGANGVKYQLQQGVHADFVISGESTQLDIVHKAKGIMKVQLATKGIAAHSAYPWNGTNAIEQMTVLLSSVKKVFPSITENMWRSTYNVATIHTTNSATNVIPDNCTCVLDIRYVKEELESIKQKLLSLNDENNMVKIEYIEPAHSSAPNNTYIQKLSTAVESVMNVKPTMRGAHGASDVRHFDEACMVGVEFGPTGGGLHTESEWVDLKSLDVYEHILTDFLLSLDRT